MISNDYTSASPSKNQQLPSFSVNQAGQTPPQSRLSHQHLAAAGDGKASGRDSREAQSDQCYQDDDSDDDDIDDNSLIEDTHRDQQQDYAALEESFDSGVNDYTPASNLKRNDDSEENENPITNISKMVSSKDYELEALPLIGAGHSMEADMIFGWRPENIVVSGAPIPLNYNYETVNIPLDPETGKEAIPIYFGQRHHNSLEVHKNFANKASISDCPSAIKDPKKRAKDQDQQIESQSETQSSYTFKFPQRAQILKRQESVRDFAGMNPNLDYNSQQELRFNSQFESGNLDMVIRKPAPFSKNIQTNATIEYDIYMRCDTNTRGHHQWFYFSAEYLQDSAFSGKTVRFNVVNFTKKQSLYCYGMRVAMSKRSTGYNWFKGGDNISYSTSHIKRPSLNPYRPRFFYKLTFEYKFDAESDKIYFAYCFPYTFSKLQNLLRSVEPAQKEFTRETVLCKSLSGLDVPLITISSRIRMPDFNMVKLSEFQDEVSKQSVPHYKRKKYVIIGARVHPGESNASWMMQGFLKAIMGNSNQAIQLRKRIIFKIIPMVNPDGVISGNYRTSMSGNDLNRQYHAPNSRLHPTVCAIKKICNILTYGAEGNTPEDIGGEKIGQQCEDILAFIDMHGHSRKKNVFIYGPQVPLHSDKYYKMRIIPKLISEETSKFRYPSCRFKQERSKLKTARIVLWREFAIENCFTFEASFHGYFDEKNTNYEFSQENFEEMGTHLVNSLYEYVMILEETDRAKKLKDKKKKERKKLIKAARQDTFKIVAEKKQSTNQVNEALDQTQKTQQNSPVRQNLQNTTKEIQSSANGITVKNVNSTTGSSSKLKKNPTNKTSSQRNLMQNNSKKPQVSTRNNQNFTMNIDEGINNQEGHLRISSGESHRNSENAASDQTGNILQANNPNEPPNEDLMQPGSSTQQSDMRVNRVIDDDIASGGSNKSQKTCNFGFRNIKDLFKAVKREETEIKAAKEHNHNYEVEEDNQEPQEPGTEPDVEEEQSEVHDDDNDNGDPDELTVEEQSRLHKDIINVIKEFSQINNQEYGQTGVLANLKGIPTSKTAKKAKKKKKKDDALAAKYDVDKKAVKEKPVGSDKKIVKEDPNKKKDLPSRKSSQSHTQNYQNYTVSIAQKRRSQNEREDLNQGRSRKNPQNLTYYNFSKPAFLQEQQNPMVVFQDKNAIPPHLQNLYGGSQKAANGKGIINFTFQPTAAQGAAAPQAPSTSQGVAERTMSMTNKASNLQLSHQQQWQLMQQQQQSQRLSGQQNKSFFTFNDASSPEKQQKMISSVTAQNNGKNKSGRTRNSSEYQQTVTESPDRTMQASNPTSKDENKNPGEMTWKQAQIMQQNKFLIPSPEKQTTQQLAPNESQQFSTQSSQFQVPAMLIQQAQPMTKEDLAMQTNLPFQFKLAHTQGGVGLGVSTEFNQFTAQQAIHKQYPMSQYESYAKPNNSYMHYSGIKGGIQGLDPDQIIRQNENEDSPMRGIRSRQAEHAKNVIAVQSQMSSHQSSYNNSSYNVNVITQDDQNYVSGLDMRSGRKNVRQQRTQDITNAQSPFNQNGLLQKTRNLNTANYVQQYKPLERSQNSQRRTEENFDNASESKLVNPGLAQIHNKSVYVEPQYQPYSDNQPTNLAQSVPSSNHQLQRKQNELSSRDQSITQKGSNIQNKAKLAASQNISNQNYGSTVQSQNPQNLMPIMNRTQEKLHSSPLKNQRQLIEQLPQKQPVLSKISKSHGHHEKAQRREIEGKNFQDRRYSVEGQVKQNYNSDKVSARTTVQNQSKIVPKSKLISTQDVSPTLANNAQVSTSLNLVSHQRRQVVGTPQKINQPLEVENQPQQQYATDQKGRQQGTTTTTNLEKLNSFLRHGAGSKNRPSLGNSQSSYKEGDNAEKDTTEIQQSNRGRPRGGSGNDIFYASMDQNATMTSHKLIPITQNSSAEPQAAQKLMENQQMSRYQTINDQINQPPPQVQRPQRDRSQYRADTENKSSPPRRIEPILTHPQRKNDRRHLKVASSITVTETLDTHNYQDHVKGAQTATALRPKQVQDNNYVVSSQQWPRGALVQGGVGLMSLKDNIQATVGQNQSNDRLNTGLRKAGNSNVILDKESVGGQNMKQAQTAAGHVIQQFQKNQVNSLEQNQNVGQYEYRKNELTHNGSPDRRSHNYFEGDRNIMMIHPTEIVRKQQQRTPQRQEHDEAQENIGKKIASPYEQRQRQNQQMANNMPQQSIVHMNQPLEESPNHMGNQASDNERLLTNEDKKAQNEMSPEVKGKCFPPGRTTNIFNMQRTKYQFVTRKQPRGSAATASSSVGPGSSIQNRRIPSQNNTKRQNMTQQVQSGFQPHNIQYSQHNQAQQQSNQQASPSVTAKQFHEHQRALQNSSGPQTQKMAYQNRMIPTEQYHASPGEPAGVVVVSQAANSTHLQALAATINQQNSLALNSSESKKAPSTQPHHPQKVDQMQMAYPDQIYSPKGAITVEKPPPYKQYTSVRQQQSLQQQKKR